MGYASNNSDSNDERTFGGNWPDRFSDSEDEPLAILKSKLKHKTKVISENVKEKKQTKNIKLKKSDTKAKTSKTGKKKGKQKKIQCGI